MHDVPTIWRNLVNDFTIALRSPSFLLDGSNICQRLSLTRSTYAVHLFGFTRRKELFLTCKPNSRTNHKIIHSRTKILLLFSGGQENNSSEQKKCNQQNGVSRLVSE